MRGHVISLAILLASFTALAEETVVGNVGLRSVDIPTANLAPFEAALDRSISLHAHARAKTATLTALGSDVEVSNRRDDGRRAANAGANAMRQLELDKAQEEFDRAAALFVASYVDRLEPSEVARIYTTRGKLAQMRRNAPAMKADFALALPLHPTKQLDAATFPPDSVALFAQVQAEALKAPMVAPAAVSLQEIAKRTSSRWVVAGEVRGNAPASPRVLLTIVDDAGASRSIEFLAPPEDPNSAFDAAIAKIFAEAGVPPRTSVAVASTTDPFPVSTGIAAATPRPVPSQALPRPTPTPTRRGQPVERRWYFLAGAALLALSGGVVLASQSGKESKSTQDPPPDEGITLVIDQP